MCYAVISRADCGHYKGIPRCKDARRKITQVELRGGTVAEKRACICPEDDIRTDWCGQVTLFIKGPCFDCQQQKEDDQTQAALKKAEKDAKKSAAAGENKGHAQGQGYGHEFGSGYGGGGGSHHGHGHGHGHGHKGHDKSHDNGKGKSKK
ncbi:hypothetical protein V8F33_002718 [Rhypophila sp. PSN 637]